MPNLISHIVCASLVKKHFKVEDEFSFFQGAIYPDVSDDTHYKTISKNPKFLVPNITLFLNQFNSSLNDFQKGILCHLLLDKYFLENLGEKYGINVFLSGEVYKDYDIISPWLIKTFNLNRDELHGFFNFEIPINEKKLKINEKFIDMPETATQTKVIDYQELVEFLNQVSNQIAEEMNFICYGTTNQKDNQKS